MNKNYPSLIENILKRANPENLPFQKSFSDELSTINYSDILRYITIAMNGVEPEYTQRSKDAGERVKSHLNETLTDVVYKYQGSVMTNTHIKGNSDIDLLVISSKFYSFDRAGIQSTLVDSNQIYYLNQKQVQNLRNELDGGGYSYDTALNDLRTNRIKSENKLKDVYDICDTTHAKAIKIRNQSLKRDVDVVIANWYDDVKSVINDKENDYRGIQVYNKDTNSKGNPDYPFLSIKRINEKSSITGGRLKKMIRFLKNVKADSSMDIKLSSFDFNAICYDINIDSYKLLNKYMLVPIIYNQLYSIATNGYVANSLKSVDEHEYIFRNNSEKLESLRNLLNEVNSILVDLKPNLV
ncbi:hypothetical protein J2810_002607 [Chryseobacterium rhizosphaerae]|uniref:hypothetical protein n=1 Tax=Chryseobacterium rhizosphaerae TaxID=395937 RepID=UPI002864C33E|nr:hypothetical protein [Chryseobacterium rhizosphaerae]MDR6546548.1 hypothetical protein [Chryseobacterium rhizosphaerae]